MGKPENLQSQNIGLIKLEPEKKPTNPKKNTVRRIITELTATAVIGAGFGLYTYENFLKPENNYPPIVMTDPITDAQRCAAIEMAEELGVVRIYDAKCKKELTPEQKKQVEIQRVLALMPTFEGFQKAMKEVDSVEKYVYVAQKGNRYGIEVGAIGGFYKEEVTFEGEKVGGIAFVPKIVEKLLSDRDGKVFFIPADISEINNKDFVDVQLSDIHYNGNIDSDFWIKVNTHGNSVSLSSPSSKYIINNSVNANPDNFLEQIVGGFVVHAEDGNRYAAMVLGNFKFDKYSQEQLPLGTKIISTNDIFGVMFNSAFSDLISIKKEEILAVEHSIVFLKDTN